MNLQNVRWPVVVAAMAATLAVLFGAGFVMKSQMWEEPLKTLYASNAAVQSYAIERNDSGYEIRLMLKDTPDMASAYRELDEGTGRILKDTPYTFKIEDRRDPALTEAYHQMNLYVQEALTTGQFSAMAQRVQDDAAKAGLAARVDVDSDRVYVQVKDQTGAYLYSVVKRPVARTAQIPEGGIGL